MTSEELERVTEATSRAVEFFANEARCGSDQIRIRPRGAYEEYDRAALLRDALLGMAKALDAATQAYERAGLTNRSGRDN